MIRAGDEAPDFELPSTSGQSVRLKDLRGGPVVLYFYPRDGTPGCTLEARLFRAYFESISLHNATLLGVSRDNMDDHCDFQDRHDLPFDLLSDPDSTVHSRYGAFHKPWWSRQDRMRRCTFLIAPGGTVAKSYYNVRVPAHPRNVVRDLEAAVHMGWNVLR